MNVLNGFGGDDSGHRYDVKTEGRFSSDREDGGLAGLERLSLEELAALASREIGESRQLQAEAVGLARRSAVTLFRAGRILWCARRMFKGKGKRAWTRWQRENQIPITSAWQAIRLYEAAKTEEAIAGRTRSQALQKYGITKPKKRPAQRLSEPGGENTAEAPANSPDLHVGAEGDPEVSEEPCSQDDSETDLAEAVEKPQTEEQAGTQDRPALPSAAEILFNVVRRLELLERDTRGHDLGDEAHAQIDRAIATLQRLRGDAAPETEAV